ncbi:MAG: OB-fold nucleic acid binding domain-containing protein [Candidatus Nanoarchaeia archaeon]|nr:OB-fold nucleic acid binding domain-containing protein [Candidatus Nanoarchaeia archaeon]
MQQSTLLKISILCSVIGLFILVIVSENLSLNNSNISLINSSQLEQKVKIKGVIKQATNKDTVSFLTVEDLTGNISVVAFQPSYKFQKQDIVEVEGIVSDNYNQIQINALSIKKF